jgi:hypothetical protein
MKHPYWMVLYGSLAFALCSCASSGHIHSSVSVNGRGAPTMDLTNPRFYMNESEMAPILSDPRFEVRPADIQCGSDCGF